jgi:hypothetical protein
MHAPLSGSIVFPNPAFIITSEAFCASKLDKTDNINGELIL